jgi:hypothetical protein
LLHLLIELKEGHYAREADIAISVHKQILDSSRDRQGALRDYWRDAIDFRVEATLLPAGAFANCTAQRQADWRQTLHRSLGGLRYVNVAMLEPGLIAETVRSPFVASVSRLECFAACPFRHFAENLLRLEQRVEADTSHIDLGLLCHAILEKLVAELARDFIAGMTDRFALQEHQKLFDQDKPV